MAQSGFPGNDNALDAIYNNPGNNDHAAFQIIAELGDMVIETTGMPPTDPASFVLFDL